MKTAFYLLSLCAVVSLAACSSKDSKSGEESGDVTPASLGQATAKTYRETMSAVVKALAEKPAPADAKKAIQPIIEAAEKKLVEIGKQRESMTAVAKGEFDSAVSDGIGELPADVFEKFSDLSMHYQTADRAVGALLTDVNIITQFANFDLLKKQNPEAAKKYGVQ